MKTEVGRGKVPDRGTGVQKPKARKRVTLTHRTCDRTERVRTGELGRKADLNCDTPVSVVC